MDVHVVGRGGVGWVGGDSHGPRKNKLCMPKLCCGHYHGSRKLSGTANAAPPPSPHPPTAHPPPPHTLPLHPPPPPPHPHLTASIPSSRECDRDADPSQRGRIISRRPASMGHRDHSKPTDSSVSGLAGVTLCRPLWSMLRSQNFLLESAFSTCPSFKRARLWPQKVCWNIKIITDSE